MSVVVGTAKVLRYAAFAILTFLGLVGGLFAAGYAFQDLSLGAATVRTAAVAVPTIVLSVLAFRSPGRAAPWLVSLTGVAAVFTLLDAGLGLIDADSTGPVVVISVFAVAVSLGFLGLHRPSLAGLLLVLLGVAQLGAVVLGFSGELAEGTGPGLANILTTSSGIVVVPLLVVGVLFLVAGALMHDSLRFWHLPTTMHPAH